MKQILTPEDINFLEEKMSLASSAPWSVMCQDDVDTAWVVPSIDGNPIALFDYRSKDQNMHDADFVVNARNYFQVMLSEIKALRKRVLELIQSNNVEVQKRMDLQTELNELKKILQNQK